MCFFIYNNFRQLQRLSLNSARVTNPMALQLASVLHLVHAPNLRARIPGTFHGQLLADPWHFTGFRQCLQKKPPVIIILEDRLTPVPARNDVIECARIDNANATSHAASTYTVLPILSIVDICRLTPSFAFCQLSIFVA